MEDLFEYDELKMYFGEPYYINDKIVLQIPTIGDIIEFGEKEYYGMIYTLTCIPSDMKSQLDDIGINYMEISDFELFMLLTRELSQQQTKLVLGPLDLSKFVPCVNTQNNETVLYDEENEIVIDNYIYMKMVHYIRKVHNIKPKVERAATETTRKILIKLDRDRIKKNKNKPYKSQLLPLISAMMRYPGFKYKKSELKECNLYEFMDTIYGAQIYVSSTALLQGSYSGMIDTSKIDSKNFNWMRSSSD